MPRSRLFKGQAEIIGGIIALSVLLLSIGMLYTTLMQLSSTSTKGFIERAAFEAEKNAEKLTIEYDRDSNSCILKNSGNIDVTIVRIWINNNNQPTPIDIENLVIPTGSTLAKINTMKIDSIIYIITRRGNVISAAEECRIRKREEEGEGTPMPSVYVKNNILGDETYLNLAEEKNQQNKLYAYINSINNIKSVAYNLSNNWYYNDGTRWYLCSSSSCRPNIDGSSDADLNKLNELIIIDKDGQNLNEFKLSGTDITGFVLKNFINLKNAGDTIMIYFKTVIKISRIQGSGQDKIPPPQEVISDIRVIFAESGNINKNVSVPVAVTTFGSGGWNVLVGTAIIPKAAFRLYNQLLSGDIYDLIIEIKSKKDTPGNYGITRVRLETIAVSGADIAWLPPD
ncbi:MAG: hypothetical protein QW456_11815 [Ignisphaera sp.]